jgi:hypothetical protein
MSHFIWYSWICLLYHGQRLSAAISVPVRSDQHSFHYMEHQKSLLQAWHQYRHFPSTTGPLKTMSDSPLYFHCFAHLLDTLNLEPIRIQLSQLYSRFAVHCWKSSVKTGGMLGPQHTQRQVHHDVHRQSGRRKLLQLPILMFNCTHKVPDQFIKTEQHSHKICGQDV